MDLKEKKARLASVPIHKRKRFAREHEITKLCDSCKKENRLCAYVGHWDKETTEFAYSVLVEGKEIPKAEKNDLVEVKPVEAGAGNAMAQLFKVIAAEAGVASKEEIIAAIVPDLDKKIDDKLKILPPKVIKIKSGEDFKEIEGLKHKSFERILYRAKALGVVNLVGPAGSGKSVAAEQVADALGLRFRFTSASIGMSEGILTGRLLPVGDRGKFDYVISDFVDCYENGGLFLLDEGDNADPNVFVKINAAIAGDKMSIDHRIGKTIAKRHKDFVFIMACNTFGTGSDRVYVGRNQLDAATLNRFQIGTVEVEYDNELEKQLVSDDWFKWGIGVREAVNKHGLRRICSTRDMVNAHKLEDAGESKKNILRSYYAGWKGDELAKVSSGLK